MNAKCESGPKIPTSYVRLRGKLAKLRASGIADLELAVKVANAGDLDKAAFQAARGVKSLQKAYKLQVKNKPCLR